MSVQLDRAARIERMREIAARERRVRERIGAAVDAALDELADELAALTAALSLTAAVPLVLAEQVGANTRTLLIHRHR